MIHVIAPGTEHLTAQVVTSALQRSCGWGSASAGSIALADPAMAQSPGDRVYVFIHPREEWTPTLLHLLDVGAKVLLLGRMTTGLAQRLQVRLAHEWPQGWAQGTLCPPAPLHAITESAAQVTYPAAAPQVAGRRPALGRRPFRRHDYADEWNNLGYGAITADGTCWSIAQHATVLPEQELARVDIAGVFLCSYAGLWDLPASSLLLFNRAAGPSDSQEWRMVEDFLSCHRADRLPCVPVLSEIPEGFDAAVTMRLDCDEDVESARPLHELYLSENVPFSLALHSRVLADPRHHRLPHEVLRQGGAILSHTATHAPNWGGSHSAALDEGRISASIIEDCTGYRVRYAVSPFHQTPIYARAGLADAGYRGCIGGIIHNDPDFLMARSGMPPGSGPGFIGHSQQCMLHGDCLLEGTDPLRVFRQAFDIAKTGGAFFGYLDHPFSERYTYGWTSEEQRVSVHREFIAHIRATGGRVLWVNENDAMDFLTDRAHTRLHATADGWQLQRSQTLSPWRLSVRYRSQHHAVDQIATLA